jgi:RNA polymerase sigma-70 factor (ECF subfamily)
MAGIQSMAILNEEVFEKLFTDWFAGLHTYACSILEDDTDAGEVVQIVFCRIWERRETLSIPGSMKAYLYGSVYHACIDALRRRKTARNRQDRQPETAQATRADGKMELGELEKRYTRLLDELPEQCRHIFQLSRFGDLSYGEIAEQLKISVKTVEAQMSKALKRLRRGLADYL